MQSSFSKRDGAQISGGADDREYGNDFRISTLPGKWRGGLHPKAKGVKLSGYLVVFIPPNMNSSTYIHIQIIRPGRHSLLNPKFIRPGEKMFDSSKNASNWGGVGLSATVWGERVDEHDRRRANERQTSVGKWTKIDDNTVTIVKYSSYHKLNMYEELCRITFNLADYRIYGPLMTVKSHKKGTMAARRKKPRYMALNLRSIIREHALSLENRRRNEKSSWQHFFLSSSAPRHQILESPCPENNMEGDTYKEWRWFLVS